VGARIAIFDFESAFVTFLHERATRSAVTVRWLLLKDVQILRRSPLLVTLARRVSDPDRAVDRLRAVARAREAARGLPQRGAGVAEQDQPRGAGRST